MDVRHHPRLLRQQREQAIVDAVRVERRQAQPLDGQRQQSLNERSKGQTAVVAIAMLIVWKRWVEPLMVVIPLILEALCFITVTTIVNRPRPDVPHLDTSPVGSSYPSGHTGAAVAYSAIVIVIFWHTRRRWIRGLAVAVAAIVPVLVALARLYRGMHFLTDIIFGALLGATSVIASYIVVRRAAEREHQQVEAVQDHGSDGEEVEYAGATQAGQP